MIAEWDTHIVRLVEDNRDAFELDVSVDEARARGIVDGNETYIGRRVIAANISRELPSFIQYLAGSYRHITAKCISHELPSHALAAIELEFTKAFRLGSWLEYHMQAVQSMELHGRGVFFVMPDSNPESPLGTAAAYVAPEDFVFPLKARDLQKASMIGIRYSISDLQYDEWKVKYQWDPAVAEEVRESITESQRVNEMYVIYLMLQKRAGIVEAFWFSNEKQKILRKPYPYHTGMYDGTGAPVPVDRYPLYPVYYQITEDPYLIERKGRAHADMHDQEALTMGWTASVNGQIRASETYISLADNGLTENPEIAQTDFVVQPGRVLKKKVEFHHAPWPDSSMLATMQALRTENASQAGQVDYAAMERKGSRKTATELDLAQEQTDKSRSIPLTMFSLGYGDMLRFMWSVLVANMRSGFNTTFLADQPDVREMVIQATITVAPAGDIDYIERNDKLKLLMQLYPTYAQTGAGPVFLQKILELAFPNDYAQLAPLLQDNTRALGAQLTNVLQHLPPDAVPPGDQPALQQLIAAGAQSFGGVPENATGPAQS